MLRVLRRLHDQGLVSLPIMRSLLQLSIPMMVQQLINMGAQFLCVSMLAYQGDIELAAAAVAFSVQIPIMMMAIAFLSIISVVISRSPQHAHLVIHQQGWVISFILSVVVILCFQVALCLLKLLGFSGMHLAEIQNYLLAYSVGVLFTLLSACNTQYGNSTGRYNWMCAIGVVS